MNTVTVFKMNGSLENAHAFEMTPEELYSTNFKKEPELWRQVFKYPDESDLWPYYVSSHGHVVNLGGRRGAQRGRILKPWAGGTDYPYVSVWRNCERWDPRLNLVVLWAFLGPPTESNWHGDHIDFDHWNNAAWNLRWLPPGVNSARNGGTRKMYEVSPGVFKTMSELTEEEFAVFVPF